MSTNLCRCGGGRAHHENDIACWCPRCLSQAQDMRCTQFSPHIPVTLPRPPKTHSTPSSPAPTQTRTDDPLVVNNSSPAAAVLDHISGTGDHGATTGEIATHLGFSSQTASAAIRGLVKNESVVSRGSPRKIGADVEQVWLAVNPGTEDHPRQTTLWA